MYFYCRKEILFSVGHVRKLVCFPILTDVPLYDCFEINFNQFDYLSEFFLEIHSCLLNVIEFFVLILYAIAYMQSGAVV